MSICIFYTKIFFAFWYAELTKNHILNALPDAIPRINTEKYTITKTKRIIFLLSNPHLFNKNKEVRFGLRQKRTKYKRLISLNL